MNTISFQDWQSIIRLPCLILMAFYLDQNGRIFDRQLLTFTEDLVRAQAKSTSTIPHLIADALREFTRCWDERGRYASGDHIAYCAVAVEAARRSLSEPEFRQLCTMMSALMAALLEDARKAAPWYLRWRGRAKNDENHISVIRLANYLREVVGEGQSTVPQSGIAQS